MLEETDYKYISIIIARAAAAKLFFGISWLIAAIGPAASGARYWPESSAAGATQ
jgi:hypothetical protein